MRRWSADGCDKSLRHMSLNHVAALQRLCTNNINNQIDSKAKIPDTENNMLRGKMDDYYKLAAAYFKEFEPRSSFPGLKTYHWYLWSLSLACFCYFAYVAFAFTLPAGEKTFWKMLVSEVVFLVSCGLIAFYRFKQTVRATSEESDLKPYERLNLSKRVHLEKLLGRPSWQFMTTAKEIMELRGLEKACRSPADPALGEILTKIYDPAAKARLLTFITALLGLLVGVLGKSDGFNLLEALSDEGTWSLIKALAQLLVVIFFCGVATYYAFRQLLEVLPLIFSSLFPNIRSNQTTLDYLIRDLIQLHRMEPPAPPAAEPEPDEKAPAPPPIREPGLGTLIAAVCLSLLRQPPAPSDNAKAAPAAQNNKSDRP